MAGRALADLDLVSALTRQVELRVEGDNAVHGALMEVEEPGDLLHGLPRDIADGVLDVLENGHQFASLAAVPRKDLIDLHSSGVRHNAPFSWSRQGEAYITAIDDHDLTTFSIGQTGEGRPCPIVPCALPRKCTLLSVSSFMGATYGYATQNPVGFGQIIPGAIRKIFQ